MRQGRFQIYTGDGKGKTTAAMGLALWAAGAGMRVFIGQFIKDREYSEVALLRRLPGIRVELFGTGRGCLITGKPDDMDRAFALRGVERILAVMASGLYDLVIADEINVAWLLGLITREDWERCARGRPPQVELVFTGRGLPPGAEELAHLITHMQEVRHYYSKEGLPAREGIEY